jgi:hypothetical protein
MADLSEFSYMQFGKQALRTAHGDVVVFSHFGQSREKREAIAALS